MNGGIRNHLLRLAFHLLYNEFAFTYNVISRLVSLDQWRDWQRAALPHLDDIASGPILELAHGTGALQVDLLRANYATVALDLSPHMGRIARKRLLRAGLSTHFIRGNALCLPFADGSFAAVISTFPASFIMDEDCLAEICRILELRGRAIIVLSARLEGRGLRRAFIRLLYRITGQSGSPAAGAAAKRAFAGYGLTVEPVDVPCVGSVVQLIVLRKTMPDVSNRDGIGLAIDAQT